MANRTHLIAWREQHAPAQTLDEWHQQLKFGEVPQASKYLVWRTATAFKVRRTHRYPYSASAYIAVAQNVLVPHQSQRRGSLDHQYGLQLIPVKRPLFSEMHACVDTVQFFRSVGLLPLPEARRDDDELSEGRVSGDSAVRLPSEGVDQV